MAIKLVSRGGQPVTQQVPSQQPIQSQGFQEDINNDSPSFFHRLLQGPSPEQKRGELTRGLFALGRGTLDVPANLVNLASTITQPVFGFEGVQTPTQKIQQALGYSSEQLEPQSPIENISQRFMEVAPATALLGVPGALGRAAIGSALGGGLEALGAPKLVADIAQIGSDIYGASRAGRLPTAPKKIGAYETFAKGALGKGELHAASSLPDVIQDIKINLGRQVDKKVIDSVNDAINAIEKNLVFDSGATQLSNLPKRYAPDVLRDIRKNLYKFYKTAPYEAKPFINQLTQGINAQFTANMAENPKFFDNLSKSDQLVQMKNMQTLIGDNIEALGGTITKFLGGSREPGKYLGSLVAAPANVLEKIIRNKTARPHYLELASAILKEDPGLFAKSLQALQDEIPITASKPSPSAQQGPRMKLVSRIS